ncbi:low molecular weight phosphotyrosine protein phosphatase [Clostridium cochlearium]|uniref:arsenate reductase/protein-tyrosine-phosphatase family protein n=1 Tax=Clostridium cochlearium TaxID=1494 RepID=UPI00241E6823|nr:low molecular weight phosphotyrosine protein phosphatase [Clostridium cochlearium]MBE6065675.1 low molecular weight phosphotyrosine protein phosphatase [Clostridium cochlearium]
MIKVMFVSHGNMVEEKYLSDKFYTASSATSREEIGNSVHWGTKNKLSEVGISCDGKTAVQITKKDYEIYDYVICMESYNIKNVLRIVGEDKYGKIHHLKTVKKRKG